MDLKKAVAPHKPKNISELKITGHEKWAKSNSSTFQKWGPSVYHNCSKFFLFDLFIAIS